MTASPEPAASQFFHRPALAAALDDQALDTSLGISGGMFLAAPRRTGKSTFVRQDLVPEFERRNLNVIYVDLWINKAVNPVIHIANAIRTELAREDGAMAKTLEKTANFLNIVASLPPLQSALLRELAADSLLGPAVRRPGLFSAAMKTRLLARLEAEMGTGHGVPVGPPSVQNALDKLREEGFLWRSQRGAYAVGDEQFLEWLAQDAVNP